MKKCLSLLVLVSILFVLTAQAQNWLPVGPDDNNQASFNPAAHVSMTLDNSGNPYIAFRDDYISNDEKLTVRKFSHDTWTNVGTPAFSEGKVTSPVIAFDNSNTPYVVYQDAAYGEKATLKKFDGADWVTVGIPGFTTGAVNRISLAFDGNNMPHVLYIDASTNNLYVVRFDGSNWVPLDQANLPATVPYGAASIAIDRTYTPYIIYHDVNNAGRATVKKFTVANQWETVGLPGFSTNDIYNPSIRFGSFNTPYVVYRDGNAATTVQSLNGSNWLTVGTSLADAVDASIAIDVDGRPYVVYTNLNDGSVSIKRWNNVAWIAVGSGVAGFPGGSVYYLSISIDGNNNAYIAYNDYSLSNKAVVKKFDGTNWPTLGVTGFTPGGAPYFSAKIDNNNTPYVVFEDLANGGMASVKKFDGSAWTDVGMAGFSGVQVSQPDLAIDATGALYVVYQDRNNGRASVKKFDGSSWADVGNPGFSTGSAYYTTIAVDGSNTPYVAYRDGANGNRVTVKKFNGTSWETMGGLEGFSTNAVEYPSLAFNSTGTLYLSYVDVTTEKATVKQYTGAAWVTVGIEDFTGVTNAAYIAIDVNDIPYIAYSDEDNGDKATVKRFNGSTWEDVGTPGFSTGGVGEISLALNTTGTPYVAYLDDSQAWKATVKKYDGSNWVTVGTEGFSAGWIDGISIGVGTNDIPTVVYVSGDLFAKNFIEIPLPLHFLEFKGRLQDNEALLSWKTTNEQNTLAFIVERSTDGRNYSTLGTVNAINAHGVHQYNFKDRNIDKLGAAVVYYRLKQKDIDGRFTYSRIVTLPVNRSESIVLVYPNPVIAEAGVTVSVSKPESLELRVVDNMGHVLQSQQLNVSAGSNSLSINMSGMAKGLYYLQVKGRTVNKQFRIVKQ